MVACKYSKFFFAHLTLLQIWMHVISYGMYIISIFVTVLNKNSKILRKCFAVEAKNCFLTSPGIKMEFHSTEKC